MDGNTNVLICSGRKSLFAIECRGYTLLNVTDAKPILFNAETLNGLCEAAGCLGSDLKDILNHTNVKSNNQNYKVSYNHLEDHEDLICEIRSMTYDKNGYTPLSVVCSHVVWKYNQKTLTENNISGILKCKGS